MYADTFDDPERGIVQMAAAKYDIIVLDMLMPKMDGVETAKEILRRYGNKTPMVLFSSAAHFPPERKKDQSIFAAVLDKPIKQDYFYKMLVDKLSAVEKAKNPEPVLLIPTK